MKSCSAVTLLVTTIVATCLSGVSCSGGQPVYRPKITNSRPLIDAVLKNDVAGVERSLRNGADPDEVDGSGWTAMIHAVMYNEIPVVRVLIKSKANVNYRARDGSSPLYNAIAFFHIEMATLLLRNRADPNIAGPDGIPPICDASMKEYLSGAELLVRYHADVNKRWSKSNHTTALMWASRWSRNRSLDVVSVLIAHKADINAKSDRQATALMFSVLGNNIAVAKALISAGATIDATDTEGNTALDLARKHHEKDMILLLDQLRQRSGHK